MKKKTLLLGVLLFSIENFAQNPISPMGLYTADPTARVGLDGKMYIYGSNDVSTDFYCSDFYNVLSSSDLQNWTICPRTFEWEGTLYAPDLIYKDGTYYLYFDPMQGGEYVAEGKSPTGPFLNTTLIEGPQQIDPNIFIDDDGQAYYFWGQFSGKGAKMNPDMKTLDLSTMVDGLVTEKEHNFHEGSYVIKRGKCYYYTYADIGRNGRPTCIGYSMATSPLGPYEYKGVIVDNAGCDPASWNNHGSLVEMNGKWYVLYHRSTHNCVAMRKACIEPISFNEDGTINEVEMTSQGAGKPLCAFDVMDAARACRMGGNVRITRMPGKMDREILNNIQNGDWAEWKYIDFGEKGAKSVTLRVQVEHAGKILLYVDDETEPIGTLILPDNKGWNTFSVKTKKIKGVHKLRIAVEGDAEKEDLFRLDWLRFF